MSVRALTLSMMTVVAALPTPEARACTAFTARCGNVTLVGNNEDYNEPRTRIWFVPGTSGTLGRMYLGYENGAPQGGMNEAGLFFDGFAVEQRPTPTRPGKPRLDGALADKAMAECRTVAEVVQLFERYDRSYLENAVLMFVDSSGDSVAIEGDALVRKTGPWFVQTNFRQSSTPPDQISCPRFKTASTRLAQLGSCATPEGFRDILAATSVEGAYPTLYSNVYDLQRRVMQLYYFHDFTRVRAIDLAQELKLGAHVLEIPALFSENAVARAFTAEREQARARNSEQEHERAGSVVVDEATLEGYVGGYRFDNGLLVTIQRRGARLMAETNEPFQAELLAQSRNTFSFTNASCLGNPTCLAARLTFLPAAGGKADHLDLAAGNGAKLQGQRIANE